jgi:hypothetical protein
MQFCFFSNILISRTDPGTVARFFLETRSSYITIVYGRILVNFDMIESFLKYELMLIY